MRILTIGPPRVCAEREIDDSKKINQDKERTGRVGLLQQIALGFGQTVLAKVQPEGEGKEEAEGGACVIVRGYNI